MSKPRHAVEQWASQWHAAAPLPSAAAKPPGALAGNSRRGVPRRRDGPDYDQLLDKRPGKGDAVFAMHQDMAYWPPAFLTANDTRTVTLTLAIDDETAENGCIRYVPGSQKERKLRPHRPLAKSRDEGHAVVAQVADDEVIRLAEVPRGGVTLHDEWVVHGSPGNQSPRHRRTYVIAFRTRAIVDAERAAGFTHSHNDDVNWDVFNPEIAAAAARAEL